MCQISDFAEQSLSSEFNSNLQVIMWACCLLTIQTIKVLDFGIISILKF